MVTKKTVLSFWVISSYVFFQSAFGTCVGVNVDNYSIHGHLLAVWQRPRQLNPSFVDVSCNFQIYIACTSSAPTCSQPMVRSCLGMVYTCLVRKAKWRSVLVVDALMHDSAILRVRQMLLRCTTDYNWVTCYLESLTAKQSIVFAQEHIYIYI